MILNAALLNCFFTPLISDSKDCVEIANAIEERPIMKSKEWLREL
jgi:hypothetical protein